MLKNTKQSHKSYRIKKGTYKKRETWIYQQHKHWIDV